MPQQIQSKDRLTRFYPKQKLNKKLVQRFKKWRYFDFKN